MDGVVGQLSVINNRLQFCWVSYIITSPEKPTITYPKSFTNCYGVISRAQKGLDGSQDIHVIAVTNSNTTVVQGGYGNAQINIEKGVKFIIFAYGRN